MDEALARALPKADLHLHLDGSLRPLTLLELAAEQSVGLPVTDLESLLTEVFPPRYRSLPHYLEGFRWTTAVMRTPEAVERIARELAEDCLAAGVRYAEVRFAPSLCATRHFPEVEVLAAAARGLAAVEDATRRAAADHDHPASMLPFRAALIVCALRQEPAEHAQEAVSHALAARAAGLPVVGFDLAGPERGFPAGLHAEACTRARDGGLALTLHAGEDAGPESVKDALQRGAQRLGHGVRVLEDPGLAAELAAAGTPLEVCVTSNLQTHPDWEHPVDHPLRELLDAGLAVTLNTDNTLVSRTDLTREALVAVEAASLQAEELRAILRTSFDHAFFPGTESERQAWLQAVDAAYAAAGA